MYNTTNKGVNNRKNASFFTENANNISDMFCFLKLIIGQEVHYGRFLSYWLLGAGRNCSSLMSIALICELFGLHYELVNMKLSSGLYLIALLVLVLVVLGIIVAVELFYLSSFTLKKEIIHYEHHLFRILWFDLLFISWLNFSRLSTQSDAICDLSTITFWSYSSNGKNVFSCQ